MKKKFFKTYVQSYVTSSQIHMMIAIIGASISLLVTMALISYDPSDTSWIHFSDTYQETNNLLGSFGAYIASLFVMGFGLAAYLVPVPLFFSVYTYYYQIVDEEWDCIAASIILVLACATVCAAAHLQADMFVVPGGIVGSWLYSLAMHSFDSTIGFVGSCVLVWASAVLIARGGSMRLARGTLYTMQTVFSWEHVIKPCGRMCAYAVSECIRYAGALYAHVKYLFDGSAVEYDIVEFDFEQIVHTALLEHRDYDQTVAKDINVEADVQKDFSEDSYAQATFVQSESDSIKPIKRTQSSYTVPSSSLFEKTKPGYQQHEKEYDVQAKVLEEKLERFGVSGKVVSIQSGPVITMFEYQPHIDSKISKIVALEDDLALALQAVSIRIIAPIPGKSVVGFEVAKKVRDDVLFSDIVHSSEFIKTTYQLPLILGCDTTGNSRVIDLASTPHLLVAGSTGSGKSVALNAMLISLLCKHSPDDLKLVLIDPKRLEFAAYADIAHLVFPIVTDPRKAAPVLQWVLKTMNERYEIMSKCGARNVVDYRERILPTNPELEDMPWLVVVIDELSDLMMTAGKDVEELIARIAQMARAAGIHLIVATQRPSVDVITGLIKVNFPSRVSFKVTSKVDSRTILDGSGAEKLLGRGDMLYLNSASTLERIHGAYVTQREIENIVGAIRAQRPVQYLDLEEEIPAKDTTLSDQDEQLYKEVISFVKSIEDVSISLLQRRFKIGYNRSARIIDLLESDGYIMPADGSRTRKVVR